jgi:hypothetical protein
MRASRSTSPTPRLRQGPLLFDSLLRAAMPGQARHGAGARVGHAACVRVPMPCLKIWSRIDVVAAAVAALPAVATGIRLRRPKLLVTWIFGPLSPVATLPAAAARSRASRGRPNSPLNATRNPSNRHRARLASRPMVAPLVVPHGLACIEYVDVDVGAEDARVAIVPVTLALGIAHRASCASDWS